MKNSKNSTASCCLLLACSFLVHASLGAASRLLSFGTAFSFDPAKLVALELPGVQDVSVKIHKGMITWDNGDSDKEFLTGYNPQEKGAVISTKIQNLVNHMGTHIDTPGHVDESLLKTFNTDTIDLKTLNGPALILQSPEGQNLTAESLKSMNIPKGVERVIFRTDNSDKDLWGKAEFTKNYTGFKPDGAKWLVENYPEIKLIGVDYLSAATRDDVFETHVELLKPEDKIIPLEGLDLRKVSPGWYMLFCLPLNIAGMEGAPTRCIVSSLKGELLK